jgi:EAL and modified HD-GYP domain-containing signal transduction protein
VIGTGLLATLIPVRDARERTMAYELRTHPLSGNAPGSIDDEARATLTMLQRRDLLRAVRGRPLYVPVTPAVLRGGAITGFASADVVFFLASDALDDGDTLRALERYATAGFRFGFVGSALSAPLSEPLLGAPVAFDTGALSGLTLANTVQRLLDAGARPIARQVDDRATRERLRAAGVFAFTGRPLPRGRSASNESRPRVLRALTLLTALADGRPPDASFDAFVASDPVVAQSVLRATTSAAVGTTKPRTLTHAFALLGRDAMLERLVVATAFLLGECGGDAELPAIAIRRSRSLERLGGALDRVGHQRARVLAGVLSVADVATGLPPVVLAEELNAPPLLRDALVERRAPLGALLDVLEAHEYGWWDDLFARCAALGIAPAVVGDAWFDGWQHARVEIVSRTVSDA